MDVKKTFKVIGQEELVNTFDVSIAAYLINPLLGSYQYQDVAGVAGIDIPSSRAEILGKTTVKDAFNAGSDALLVPSQFEPCGLTQLIAMHYGTVPIVRETGGLKDTVEPYNQYTNEGNGFTFDRYEAGLLLDAINRAKTLYFTERDRWDDMVRRDMAKDVSWENSAKKYRALYVEMTQ